MMPATVNMEIPTMFSVIPTAESVTVDEDIEVSLMQ